MGKVQDSVRINLCYDDAKKIIKKAIMPYGGIEKDGGYEVKSGMTLTKNPITVLITLKNEGGNVTPIDFFASSFGIGPIPKKNCQKMIDEIKFHISEEYGKLS